MDAPTRTTTRSIGRRNCLNHVLERLPEPPNKPIDALLPQAMAAQWADEEKELPLVS